MGGSKKPPKPPVIKPPSASAEEKELQKLQVDMAKQMMGQSDTTFANAQSDRNMAFDYLDLLNEAPKLSQGENDLINQLSDTYLNMSMKGITEGTQKEIFDRNLRDSLAYLSDQGVLNSTFGQETIGDLYKEKARLIASVSDQAGMNKLGLTKDALEKQVAKNMDLFQSLYTGAGAGSNLATQMANSGFQGAQGAAQGMKADRDMAFQAMMGNAQSKYMYDMQNYQAAQKKKKSMFGLGGAALGLGIALAPFTGGASLAAAMPAALGGTLGGAALGAGLGYGVGSTVGGFI